MTERRKSALTFAASLVVLGLAWESFARLSGVNQIILPPPSRILESLWFIITNLFSRVAYWEDAWITLYEIILGFLVGSSAAIVVGSLVAEFQTVRRVVVPYTVALNATPKIAFAPLFAVWFGFGAMPKILIAAFICFFPVLINTVTGLGSVEQEQLELMASLRSSRWQTFRRLKMFQALPYVFASLRTAMAFAAIGAVIGEFAGAQEGLGFQIEFAAARLETANLFAFIVVLSAMAYILYSIIALIERRVLFWSTSSRGQGLG